MPVIRDEAPASGAGAGTVDLRALREAAQDVVRRAYAPYSGFPVGAAGLADDGRVVVGCNVENAAYGVGLCAECGLVSALHAGGGGHLVAVAVVDADGQPCPPCGRCRQLLLEAGGAGCLVDQGPDTVPVTVGDLLPDAFVSFTPRVPGPAHASLPVGQARAVPSRPRGAS